MDIGVIHIWSLLCPSVSGYGPGRRDDRLSREEEDRLYGTALFGDHQAEPVAGRTLARRERVPRSLAGPRPAPGRILDAGTLRIVTAPR